MRADASIGPACSEAAAIEPQASPPAQSARFTSYAASTLIRYAGEQLGRRPALDDPVANLRQPARVGNILQRGGQPARCGCVELPLRLPAQQRPFFGAALRDPLLSALRPARGLLRPTPRSTPEPVPPASCAPPPAAAATRTPHPGNAAATTLAPSTTGTPASTPRHPAPAADRSTTPTTPAAAPDHDSSPARSAPTPDCRPALPQIVADIAGRERSEGGEVEGAAPVAGGEAVQQVLDHAWPGEQLFVRGIIHGTTPQSDPGRPSRHFPCKPTT